MPSACPRCGYPRMGLTGDANCPECGFPFCSDAPCFRFNRRGIAPAAGALLFLGLVVQVILTVLRGFPYVLIAADLILATEFGLLFRLALRGSDPTWTVSREGIVFLVGGRIRRFIPWLQVGDIQVRRFFPSYIRVYPPPNSQRRRARLFRVATGAMARAFVPLAKRFQRRFCSPIARQFDGA